MSCTLALASGRQVLAPVETTILKLMWSSSAADTEPAPININVELSKAAVSACRCILFASHRMNISGKNWKSAPVAFVRLSPSTLEAEGQSHAYFLTRNRDTCVNQFRGDWREFRLHTLWLG